MLEKILSLIAEVESQLKSHNDFLVAASKDLEQLNNNKQNVLNNLFTLNGALQAYKNVSKLFENAMPATDAPATFRTASTENDISAVPAATFRTASTENDISAVPAANDSTPVGAA